MMLDDTLLRPLGELIGDSFEKPELDGVVRISTGAGLFKEFATDTVPMRQIAIQLLQALEARGEVSPFLRAVLKARPALHSLHDLVGQACPDALNSEPSLIAQVGPVVTSIEEIGRSLDDPGVRKAISDWSSDLGQVAHALELLAAYKTLHDCLHRLQLQQFRQVVDAAKRFATEPTDFVLLDSCVTEIKHECSDARDAAAALPDGPTGRGSELVWIEALENAARGLSAALDGLDAGGASVCVRQFRQVIRVEPFRLNRLLTLTADALPLDPLIAALRRVLAAVAAGQQPALAAGLDALVRLAPALRGRVAEHRQWQDAENMLWMVEELLGAPDALEQFALLWPNTRGQVAALCRLEPEAEWAMDMEQSSARLDQAVAAADALRLRLVFQRYRSLTLFRFFQVDKALRAQCSATVAIAEPLRALLLEADHAG